MNQSEIEWKQWGDYAQKNGDYSISKAKVSGKWLCMLWRISTSEQLAKGTYQEVLDVFTRETGIAE